MNHGEPRNLICPSCLKSFNRRFDLKQHQTMKRHRNFTHREYEFVTGDQIEIEHE